MTLRPMTAADAGQVAALHTTALQGLLSDLGPGLVAAFYRAALRLPSTVALVADEGGPVGFVLGTTEAAGYYQRVARRSPVAVGGRMFWRMLTTPALRQRLGQGQEFAGPELLFLAVAGAARGRGFGGALIDGFEAALRARGVGQYALCVEADNARAVAVYEGRGLTVAAEFEEFGLTRCRYTKLLATEE